MNWDAVGAVAESVGALGVIASLAYVGVQIRNSNVESARANARLTASDHARALHAILEADVADIFLRGIQDMGSLSGLESYRFDLAMAAWLQAGEQAFADYRSGRYPTESLVTYRNNIPGVLNTPGGLVWWAERRVWFGHEFRADVDALLAAPPDESQRAGVLPR